MRPVRVSLLPAALVCALAVGPAARADSFVIDASLPGGGDCAAAGGTWNGPDTCKFHNTAMGPRFSTITAQSATTVEASGFVVLQLSTLVIHGELYVGGAASLLHNGILRNEAGGTIVIDGNLDLTGDPLENEGVVTVNGMLTLDGAGLLNRAGGQVVNSGTILSYDDSVNRGTITNTASGTITHEDSSAGNSISNHGLISNAGTINNDASIVNFCDGVITGNPVLGKPARLGVMLTEVDKSGFSWCDPVGGPPYLVLTGSIHDLIAFGGSLDGSTVECDDSVGGPPAAHGAESSLWFLVSPRNGGSWDSDGLFQVQPRTAACPSCNCCSGGNGTGCNLAACQSAVCSVDPYCCTTSWDAVCNLEAATLCTCCNPGPPDGHEPNDTAGAAAPATCPSFVTDLAKIWLPGEDVDWFALTGAPGADVAIDIDAAQAGSPLDTILGAFDSSMVALGTSDDDPAPGEPLTFDSYLEVAMPANGFLYIAVTSFKDLNFNGGPDQETFGPYTMTVNCP
jgi:hypothetical protein